jgi:rhamnose transport system substrate-binding protein
MKPKLIRTIFIVVMMVLVLGMTLVPSLAKNNGFTIAMVVKGAGNPFFEACRKGGEEASKELGNRFIFQGPEK